MAKLNIQNLLRRRKTVLALLGAACLAAPTPLILQYLDSITPKPAVQAHGIPVVFKSVYAIKVKNRVVSRIPIKYVNSKSGIRVTYKDLSKIRVTYRNASDGTSLTDDPRFPHVVVRSTTFRVAPRPLNN